MVQLSEILHRRLGARLQSWAVGLLCAALLTGSTGCRIFLKPLPPANFQAPGWKVREGQAVWRLKRDATELAGEVLVATNPDGRTVVQFVKSPFPLVIAQSTPRQWEAEFPPQNRRYAGPGQPPKRLIWLYLPRVLGGQTPPKGWTWQADNSGWKLENKKTGESIEGYFNE